MTGQTISHYQILEKLSESGMSPSLMRAEPWWGRNSSLKRP
jgi:hypothetical protein